MSYLRPLSSVAEERVLLRLLPSRVETLALQLVEKLRDLEEANEVVKDELRGERRDVSGRGRHAGTFGLRPAWMKKENRVRGK